jgi:hypothetical protein
VIPLRLVTFGEESQLLGAWGAINSPSLNYGDFATIGKSLEFEGITIPGVRHLSWPARGERRMKDLVAAIVDLIESGSGLARQAVAEYTPIVDSIVRTRSKDIRHIEHTLDGLLGFCFDSEALLLFKKLCRHYYFIDPAAAAEYVHMYREMWDPEPKEQP